MKTSDCIALRIKKEVDTAFGVIGGYIVNLVDSFKKNGISIIPMHHEQSAAIAADAYARFCGFGVSFSTSGPGATNMITGTACSYYDSIPVLAISGQVPTGFLDGNDRQMGFQEADSVSMFKPITKISKRYKVIDDIDVCISAAKKPRCGAAFIEVPDDLQRKDIVAFKGQTRTVDNGREIAFPNLTKYSKPLAIIGYGATKLTVDLNIPFLYTWRTKDRFYNHPWCKGGFGTTGGLNGNRLIKEADCIIMVGTRIDSHHAPDWNKFAPSANKIAVGLEFPHSVDERIDCELSGELSIRGEDWCSRVDDLPNLPLYNWVDALCEQANKDDVIIPDIGQTGCIVFQRWKIKDGQRLFNAINHSPMGYSIPASIGAAIGSRRRVIVIVGDGSLMMNLQDLQTIADLKLPINIFVVNNGGYGMIRQTQDDWKEYLLQGIGCNFDIPDVKKLADAFGLKYSDKLSYETSIFEIKCDNTKIVPKWKYGGEL